jgi:DNA-binding response OmpR family regulator
LACALRTSGYDVRVAYDAPAALRIVQSDPPDVVISDIGLPGTDGYELARRLRRNFGPDRMLLIAVSGYGQEADRLCSRDAGFDHHLVKPTGLDTILSLLGPPADLVSHVPSISDPRS